MLTWLLGPLDRRTRLVLLAGALLRAILPFWGAARLDRAFVVDDAYYTLTIARSLAQQGIASVDGSEITTGFQPLLALLEVPAFLLGASPDAGLLWGLSLLLAADTLVALLLARLASQIAGAKASIAAAAIWSLSPIALREALVGLEAPLAAMTGLLAVNLLNELDATQHRKKAFLAGLALGACLLARIDTVLFVLAVGVWLLWKRREALVSVVLGASLVAGPWLLTCLALTGRPWPESGTAVSAIVQEGQTAASLARCAAWASGYFMTGGLVDIPELREWLVANQTIGAAGCALSLAGALYFALRLPTAVRLWLLGTYALVPFYVFMLPAIWGFHRYLLPARVATTLLFAIAIGKLASRLAPRVEKPVAIASLAVLAGNALLGLLVAFDAPARGGIDGTTGYRAAALGVHANLPPGSTVGATQSGAIGYFRPENIRVINLDGVVSRSAHLAFVEHRMDQHLRERGVTHLAEWRAGFGEIFTRSGETKPTVRPYFAAEPQGSFRMVVASISWPSSEIGVVEESEPEHDR